MNVYKQPAGNTATWHTGGVIQWWRTVMSHCIFCVHGFSLRFFTSVRLWQHMAD